MKSFTQHVIGCIKLKTRVSDLEVKVSELEEKLANTEIESKKTENETIDDEIKKNTGMSKNNCG